MKEHRILERLCKNSNTVTLQPDSGKGTVIMDRDVYMRKNIWDNKRLDEIKKRLSTGPTITREGQLQRFLRSMTGKQVSTKESYDKKYPSDSKPVFIYGTPEIQKLKCNNVNDLSLCSIDKKHVESSNCTSPLYFKLTLLEICRQELNKNLPKTVTVMVKVLLLKLFFRRIKLDIYLMSKNQCQSI